MVSYSEAFGISRVLLRVLAADAAVLHDVDGDAGVFEQLAQGGKASHVALAAALEVFVHHLALELKRAETILYGVFNDVLGVLLLHRAVAVRDAAHLHSVVP